MCRMRRITMPALPVASLPIGPIVSIFCQPKCAVQSPASTGLDGRSPPGALGERRSQPYCHALPLRREDDGTTWNDLWPTCVTPHCSRSPTKLFSKQSSWGGNEGNEGRPDSVLSTNTRARISPSWELQRLCYCIANLWLDALDKICSGIIEYLSHWTSTGTTPLGSLDRVAVQLPKCAFYFCRSGDVWSVAFRDRSSTLGKWRQQRPCSILNEV